jgi:hypothetical protein
MALSTSTSPPGRLQHDGLVQRASDLAHQARKAAEHRAQRHQPHLADGGVQVADQPVELGLTSSQGLAQGLAARQLFGLDRQVGQAVLGDDQIVGQIRQTVDPLGVDPQRAPSALAFDPGDRFARAQLDDLDLIGDEAERRLDLRPPRRRDRLDDQIAGIGIVVVQRAPGLARGKPQPGDPRRRRDDGDRDRRRRNSCRRAGRSERPMRPGP